MAFPAVRAEIAVMHIITLVATDAGPGSRILRHRPPVTATAMQIFMRPFQREIAVLVMIEGPDQPVIGVVTSLALLPQCLLVHIIIGMAVAALSTFRLEGQ